MDNSFFKQPYKNQNIFLLFFSTLIMQLCKLARISSSKMGLGSESNLSKFPDQDPNTWYLPFGSTTLSMIRTWEMWGDFLAPAPLLYQLRVGLHVDLMRLVDVLLLILDRHAADLTVEQLPYKIDIYSSQKILQTRIRIIPGNKNLQKTLQKNYPDGGGAVKFPCCRYLNVIPFIIPILFKAMWLCLLFIKSREQKLFCEKKENPSRFS